MRFQGYDIRGWKCKHCGETYYNSEDAQKILLINKIKNKKYEVTIGKVRSNLIIRIPAELAKAMGLSKGEKIKIKADSLRTFYVEA